MNLRHSSICIVNVHRLGDRVLNVLRIRFQDITFHEPNALIEVRRCSEIGVVDGDDFGFLSESIRKA